MLLLPNTRANEQRYRADDYMGMIQPITALFATEILRSNKVAASSSKPFAAGWAANLAKLPGLLRRDG